MSKYRKLNVEPVALESKFIDNEITFVFDWCNKEYSLSDFIPTRSAWSNIDCPDYIHGYEAENYYNPIFIEVLVGTEAVNIYQEVAE